jgi:hypothetical protein
MKISRTLKAAAATMAVTAATLGVSQGAAHASNSTPENGQLCQAAENIQFWSASDPGTTLYTVQTNEYIRIDAQPGTYIAYGHGENHSSLYFQWRHSNGTQPSRLKNCH